MVLRGFYYVLIFSGVLLFSGMKEGESPAMFKLHQKKIFKSISRIWQNDNISIDPVISEEINYSLIVNNLNGDFFNVYDDEIRGYLYLGKANACHEGGCDRFEQNQDGRFEQFEYMVLFNTNKEILYVRILKYEAEYGFEICSKKWLAQFINKKSSLEYGTDIQGISGATVSAKSITQEINKLKGMVVKIEIL